MKNILSSKLIYDGRVIKVFFEEVEVDGMLLKREIVRHSGGCAVLAEKDGKFAFVSQYRHPFGENFFEIPAGKREVGEPVDITASRELEEECGLKPTGLEFICEYAVSPGYSDEIIYLYYANDFVLSTQNFDEDEQIEVKWLDKEEALNLAKNGKIKDGKTLVSLLWYAVNKK